MDKSRKIHRRSRTSSVPMTIDEARRIEEQVELGAIDTSVPEARRVVNQARRTGVNAYLWGSSGGTPGRSPKRWLIAGTSAVAALTIAGLAVSFLAAR